MSTDSDNIVMGRLRRFARGTMQQVRTPAKETEGASINMDEEFPTGLRVHHRDTGRNGTVQSNFPGTGSLYEPWEIPVIWDGETSISGVNNESLSREENPVKRKLKKSDLRPGMEVINIRSGKTGTVRGNPDGSLGFTNWCVGIHRRITSGKNKNRWDYPIWRVENLEIVPAK